MRWRFVYVQHYGLVLFELLKHMEDRFLIFLLQEYQVNLTDHNSQKWQM